MSRITKLLFLINIYNIQNKMSYKFIKKINLYMGNTPIYFYCYFNFFDGCKLLRYNNIKYDEQVNKINGGTNCENSGNADKRMGR